MSRDQKRARVFGVLYLITFATSITAALLYAPLLDHPVAFVAGAGDDKAGPLRRSAGTAAHHREHRHRGRDRPDHEEVQRRTRNRLRDGTTVRMHVHSRRHPLGARDRHVAEPGCRSVWGTVAYTFAAIKDWTFLLGPGWVVGWGNGLILGYLMYRTGLVPRRAALARADRRAAGSSCPGPPSCSAATSRATPCTRCKASFYHPGVPVGAVPRPLLHLQGLPALGTDPAARRRRRSCSGEARVTKPSALTRNSRFC